MSAPAATDLNDDALTEVFQFMKAKDRNNARLVCRRWNEILSQTTFTKKEVFCIPAWCNFESLTTVLEKSTRINLALRFVEHEIDDNYDSIHFWDTVGSRIESLSFDCCDFSGKSVTDIFYYCVNLKEFSDYYSSYFDLEHGNFVPSEYKLVRENLQKLCLRSSSSWSWQESNLFTIAKVFPNLKILQCDTVFGKILSTNKAKMIEFNILADQLKSIEVLELDATMPLSDYGSPHNIAANFQKASTFNWTRLRNIQMLLNSYILYTEPLGHILSHKLWTSLHVYEIDLPSSVNVTTIALLLNELPALKKFHLRLQYFTTHQAMPFDEESFKILFPALVKSHLKSIYIGVPLGRPHWRTISDLVWDETFVNWTVQRLQIDIFHLGAKNYYSAFYSHFIRHFLGLTKLYIRRTQFEEEVDPSIISKYQRKLEHLTLGLIKGIQTGLESPFSHLISLKAQSLYHNWNTFFTYQFPNLEYLHIDIIIRFDETNQCDFTESFKFLLRAISTNCPNLQGFSARLLKRRKNPGEDALKLPEIFHQCQQFHRLRYLNLDFTDEEEDDEILRQALVTYFQQCSSLRRVKIKSKQEDIHAFLEPVSREFKYSTSVMQPASREAHWLKFIRWLN